MSISTQYFEIHLDKLNANHLSPQASIRRDKYLFYEHLIKPFSQILLQPSKIMQLTRAILPTRSRLTTSVSRHPQIQTPLLPYHRLLPQLSPSPHHNHLFQDAIRTNPYLIYNLHITTKTSRPFILLLTTPLPHKALPRLEISS